jgi:sensor histidine kinase YesM
MNTSPLKGVWLHVILWIVYFVLLIFWFSMPFTYATAFWHATRMIFIHMVIFYLNTRVLLPLFSDRNRWLVYVLIILASMVVIYFYFKFTNEILPFDRFEEIRQPRSGRGGRGTRWIVQNLSFSFIVFFFSTLTFMIDQSRQRKEDMINREKAQLETEMKLLRSQVNPHFMFNALNNIYSLAIQKNELTPEAIMKLSQMLRYVLYESSVDRVPASLEWKYIENYMDIQLLKFEEHVNITRSASIDNDLYVAPMLLLPFVENAFKHSNIEESPDAFISVILNVSESSIHFNVTNSMPEKPLQKDHEGGIGLVNVRKRLNYIYPEKHSLNITESEGVFNTDLHIRIV